MKKSKIGELLIEAGLVTFEQEFLSIGV